MNTLLPVGESLDASSVEKRLQLGAQGTPGAVPAGHGSVLADNPFDELGDETVPVVFARVGNEEVVVIRITRHGAPLRAPTLQTARVARQS